MNTKTDFHLEHLVSQYPVTALHFASESLLIAGSGPYCLIYTLDGKTGGWHACGQLKNKILLLERIHHIHTHAVSQNEYLVLAAGGREARIFSLTFLSVGHKYDLIHLEDRIQDAILLHSSDSATSCAAAFLTAHNSIIITGLNGRLLRNIESELKPNLYSGRLLWKPEGGLDDREEVPNGILFAAGGTAFGQVQIYKVQFGAGRQLSSLGCLTDRLHDGSVFGIDWNEDGTCLSTCSDDRNVRVHQVTYDDTTITLTQSAVLWGNRARAWRCVLTRDSVLSVGEDACLHLWPLASSKGSKREQMTTQFSRRAHDGLNAWALAVAQSGQICATGGQDGGIKIWRLGALQHGFKAQDISHGASSSFKIVLPISSQEIVLVSTGGDIVLCRLATNETELLVEEVDLIEYNPIHVVEKRCILLFTRSGSLIVYDLLNRTLAKYNVPSNIKTVTVDSHLFEESFSMAISEPTQGLQIGRISQGGRYSVVQLLSAKEKFDFWRICWRSQLLVICEGTDVFVHHLEEGLPQILTIQFSRDAEVVSDAAIQYTERGHSVLHLSGYKGTYSSYQIRRHGNLAIHHSTSQNSTKGTIARILVTLDDVLLVAIYKRLLTVFSLRQSASLWEAKYNSLKCNAITVEPCIAIFWLSHGHLSILDKPEVEVLSAGNHGREIRAVGLSRFVDRYILITAGEDTTCQANLVSVDGTIEKACALNVHQSAIRCLKLYKVSDDISLLFTAGALTSMMCTCLMTNPKSKDIGIAWTLDGTPLIDRSNQARIMAMETWPGLYSNKPGHFVALASSDGRIDILHLTYDPDTQKSSGSFEKVSQLSFGQECCLSITSLSCQNDGVTVLVVGGTTGITRLYTFDEQMQMYEIGSVRLHQSGINSLAARWVGTDTSQRKEIECISGGDDNAITITCLSIAFDQISSTWTMSQQSQETVNDAHASGVQDLAFLGDDDVVSIGWDQRIAFRRVGRGERRAEDPSTESDQGGIDSGPYLDFAKEVYSSVCDPSCLSVVLQEDASAVVAIAGIGFEVFSMTFPINTTARMQDRRNPVEEDRTSDRSKTSLTTNVS